MYERAVARKLPVKTLFEGEYRQGKEEYDPHHISVNQQKISRVNIIGRITKKEDEFFLEDNTGNIKLVSFGEPIKAEDEDVVRVIGKIRERDEKRFLAVEAIKKINEKQLELRKLELKQEKTLKTTTKKPGKEDELEMEIEELEI